MEMERLSLGNCRDPMDRSLKELVEKDAVRRLWEHDAALWKEDPAQQAEIVQRLGWLTVVGAMREQIHALKAFARGRWRTGSGRWRCAEWEAPASAPRCCGSPSAAGPATRCYGY